MTADETQPRRRGRRQRGGDRPEGRVVPEQAPWKQPSRRFDPVDLVGEDEIEAIHRTSLQILSEIGMDFLNPEARRMLADAGARVDPDSERVRFDPDFIEEKISTAPSEFTIHARNPERNVHMGASSVAFTAVSSPPNVSDEAGGRRVGNREDFQRLLRLGHTINTVHLWGGYPVEPVDIHASVRHLDALYDMLTLSDRVIHAYSLGAQRNTDALEMIKIARQVDDATLDEQPSILSVINASSPLRYDHPMLQGIIEFSSRNQVIVITPFTLAGAMAPVTVAGALAQHNAEALAGIVFTQVVRPGAPVIYGGFTSNVDMQSGAPAFGTPEFIQTSMITGQMTRRYGLPYRSSGVNAANALDAQAAYESVFSLWGAVMGGAHLILHAVGWMEGGLRASFEKMILDADLCAMVQKFMDPIDFSEAGLALDAVRDVGPGGHFFGTPHTLQRFRTAFYQPLLSDWRNYESWEEAGKPEAKGKMIELVDVFLDSYEEPPMDPAVRAELEEFVERRRAEGGVETDY
ncbi:MAG TPA: trimethylamine methyltransferase family protein [Acidimicrobiia bacterium]|nr:trimethylamine methyltransferase family protein [Acidimicrobiia bacterium]